jgi:hypothetical protein
MIDAGLYNSAEKILSNYAQRPLYGAVATRRVLSTIQSVVFSFLF